MEAYQAANATEELETSYWVVGHNKDSGREMALERQTRKIERLSDGGLDVHGLPITLKLRMPYISPVAP